MSVKLKNNRRLFPLIFLVSTIILGLIFYWTYLKPQKIYYDTHHVSIHGIYFLHDSAIKKFNSTDMYGKNFSIEQLKNNWTFLYFGFTHCEIICPNVMQVLQRTKQILQTKLNAKDLPKVIFITIDPERDTLERVYQFVNPYGPDFLGLRGTSQATLDLVKQFYVPIKKIKGQTNQTDDYVLTHGTDILLINPAGNIQAYFTYPQKPNELAKDYEAIVMRYQSFLKKALS